MQRVTATDLKQNSMRLQDALRDDLLVTKRETPFVVVMDYEKYKLIEEYIYITLKSDISKESLKKILKERKNRKLNLTIFDKGEKISEFDRKDAYDNSI